MAGQVGDAEAGAAGRRQEHVVVRHQRVHLTVEQRARALRADVFDRRDEARGAERVRPRAGALLGQQIDRFAARKIVERRRRFRAEDEAERVGGEFGQRHRLELRARRAQHVERVLELPVALLGAAPRVFRVRAAAAAAAPAAGGGLELARDVADRETGERHLRAPVERCIDDGVVAAVAAVDRVEHDGAVLDAPAHRSDLVHRPGERHRAVAADAAVGRAQPDDAARGRGRNDRAARLGADRERDQPRRGRRARSGRRSARAVVGRPRVARRAAEPHAALRQRAHRQLGAQHRAGVAQPLDDGRVHLRHPPFVGCGPPRRPDPFGVEQILHAERDAMQRSAVAAGLDLLVSGGGLRARQVLRQRDDAVELIAVVLEPREIHAGEIGRRDPAALDERREDGDRLEGQILQVRRRVRPRRLGDGEPDGARGFARRQRGQTCSGLTPVGTEGHRRLGVERDVEPAQLLVAIEVPADAAGGHLLFRVGEVQVVDLLGALQDVLAESRRRAAAALRQRGHPDGRRHGRRHGLEEPPPSDWLSRFLHAACSNKMPIRSRR